MKLKKQGNITFALINSLSSSELSQFKKFVQFEFVKASPYLKMLSFIEKYADFDYQENIFPEDKLIKSCGDEVAKKYTKLKHQLKQSIERFIGYLALKNEPKSNIKHIPYFLVKTLVNYNSLYRLNLLEDVDSKFEEIAKEASYNGYFDLSSHIYSTVMHNIPFAYKDKLKSIERAKEIKKSMMLAEQNQIDRSEVRFYNSVFFNAVNHLSNIQKEIKDFDNLELNLSETSVGRSYYYTKSNLAFISKDYRKVIESNIKIIELLDSKEDLPDIVYHHYFSARTNASQAAMFIGEKDLALKLLEEAGEFLKKTDKLKPYVLKEFNFSLLRGKLMYNTKFEENLDKLKSSISSIENAINSEEVILNPFQQNEISDVLLLLNYIAGDYEKSYDIGYQKDNNKLSNFALICYILSLYHLFDLDFLKTTYRNIERIILENDNYTKFEKKNFKVILSKLKRLKVFGKEDENLLLEIVDLIHSFEDNFAHIEQRISNSFKNNYLS